jgi:hypothetical protein
MDSKIVIYTFESPVNLTQLCAQGSLIYPTEYFS